MSNLDDLVAAHEYLSKDLATFLDLFYKMKEEGIVTQPAIVRFVQSAGKLARLEEESMKLCEQIGRLRDKKTEIEKDIESATSLLHHMRMSCHRLQ